MAFEIETEKSLTIYEMVLKRLGVKLERDSVDLEEFKGWKKELEELNERQKIIYKSLEKLKFKHENPPKYKQGDEVFYNGKKVKILQYEGIESEDVFMEHNFWGWVFFNVYCIFIEDSNNSVKVVRETNLQPQAETETNKNQ